MDKREEARRVCPYICCVPHSDILVSYDMTSPRVRAGIRWVSRWEERGDGRVGERGSETERDD